MRVCVLRAEDLRDVSESGPSKRLCGLHGFGLAVESKQREPKIMAGVFSSFIPSFFPDLRRKKSHKVCLQRVIAHIKRCIIVHDKRGKHFKNKEWKEAKYTHRVQSEKSRASERLVG